MTIKQWLLRPLCLVLTFTMLFSCMVWADTDEGPCDYEDDNSPVVEIDWSEPDDTTFDDTTWTIEDEEGVEIPYDPNPEARWKALISVGMTLAFRTGGKAVFGTSMTSNNVNYSVKIKTRLQSYRSETWKTLYTKTRTSENHGTALTGSYYVTKGYKYRTKNTVYVYNSSGKLIESDTLYCYRTYR